MSLQYNDTSNKRGILQEIEKELGFEYGDITGNANRLKEATTLVNLTWDDYISMAIQSSGMWQYDDSNFTDYPIIKTHLVDGRRDYSFTTDEGGNLILDVYKVMVLSSATATTYDEIFPLDQQQKRAFDLDDDIAQEIATEGVPFRYDKTGNGIFLDPIPSYNATNGLKVYINREPSYFVTTDTTKKPGCPGNHQRYFVLKPALDFARRNSLTVERSLRNDVLLMEQRIQNDFARREKDVDPVMRPQQEIYE